MHKQTYFDEKWLKDGIFEWLGACDSDRMSFKCRLCCEVLKLSNIGIEAVKSHSQNAKHRSLVAWKTGAEETDTSISRFFCTRPKSSISATVAHVSNMVEVPGNVATTRCETLTVCDTPVVNPATIEVLEGNPASCQLRFGSDDLKVRDYIETAISFQMSDDMAVFGLAPYFQQLLADKVKETVCIAV